MSGSSPPSSPAPMRLCPECERQMITRRCPACDCGTIPVSALAGREDPLLGTTLDQQYTVEALLGEGGMGRVYRGRQLAMDRQVAIKVISHEFAADLEAIRRFRREARLTSRLTHPNTIRVFDFGLTESGQVYLVMELLQGRELALRIADDGPIPALDALEICIDALGALQEAHGLGIVHRDLKPGNIFLQRFGGREIAKVMDFGIAKSTSDQGGSKLTRTGATMGTPTYMAPEQARAEEVGPTTDIYALGVILFEMLTARVPFAAETPVATLFQHVTDPPPPLTDVCPDLLGADIVQPALDAMLAKSPAGRPPDAAAAAAMLSHVRRKLRDLDESSGGRRNRPSGSSSGLPAAGPESVGPRVRRGTFAITLTLAGLLLAGAGVGIAARLLRGDKAARAATDGPGPARSRRASPSPAPDERPAAATASKPQPKSEREPAHKPRVAPEPDVVAEVETPREAAAPATVRLLSRPPGAEVRLGGRLLGRTPLNIATGTAAHRVVLRMKGRRDTPMRLERGQAGRTLVLLAAEIRPARPRRPAKPPRPEKKTDETPYMIE